MLGVAPRVVRYQVLTGITSFQSHFSGSLPAGMRLVMCGRCPLNLGAQAVGEYLY